MKKQEMWVTVSTCPPERTEEFWETEDAAQQAIKAINETGCGGQCQGSANHYIRSPKHATQQGHAPDAATDVAH